MSPACIYCQSVSPSNEEKEYDRNTAIQTLKAMFALGYRIEKANWDDSAPAEAKVE